MPTEVDVLPITLIALGNAALFYVCALLAHNVAYRRGYLRTGYFLGIALGPLGLIAAALLPTSRHTAVALEDQRARSSVEDAGENWHRATFLALIAITCLTAAVAMSVQGFHFQHEFHWALAIGAATAALATLIFHRAEPPLYQLPALPQLEEPGTRDLLEWVHVRHVAARLKNSSDMLRGSVLIAIICGCVLGLLAWAVFAEENQGVRERTLPTGIAMAVVAAGLLIYAVWAAFAWRARWTRFCQMYEDYFPEEEVVEGYNPYADDEDYNAKDDYPETYFPANNSGEYRHPGPAEMEERLQERVKRLHREIGHSPERATHFAAVTEDTRERTRRMFFLKPVGALAGAWLLFKLFLHKGIQDIIPGAQPVDWQGAGTGLIAIIALWVVANGIDWLCRRIMPPP